MKLIVLEDPDARRLAHLCWSFCAQDVTIAVSEILAGLARQLEQPSEYVAAHKDNDLPLILELVGFEKETAEQQLRDHQNNNPEFVPEDEARLEYATEVYDRLKEQL